MRRPAVPSVAAPTATSKYEERANSNTLRIRHITRQMITIPVRKTDGGQPIAQIKSDQGPVFGIASSENGTRIATPVYDGRIRFYNAANGEWVQGFASVAMG